jgi:hypothetical protein
MSRLRKSAMVFAIALGSARPGGAQSVTTLPGTFKRPVSVAVDEAGTVYVADPDAGTVWKTGPDGASSFFSAPRPAGAAVRGGSVYVVSVAGIHPASDPVFIVAPDGHVTNQLNTPPGWGVSDVAVDASGAVYVVEPGDTIEGTGGGNVYQLLDGGWRPLTGPGSAHPEFDSPWRMALDAAGNLFITSWLGSVYELGAGGNLAVLASNLSGPSGIAVARTGDVFVSEAGQNRVLKIRPDGTATDVLDGLLDPEGLALDDFGNLYVADTGNNKIRKISAVAAPCSVGCTNWIVPSVAHIAGADGAFWTSDLVLHNRAGSPAPVTLKFLGNSRDGTSGPEKAFTLDPFQTVTYADVLSSVFGISDDAGALEVLTPPDQVTVRSRTFTAAAGGTVGDGISGVRQGSFFTDQTSPSPVLTGLAEDAAFRSNLILVNATAAPLVVHVAAADDSGAPIGGRDYTLPPLGMIQDSRFLTGDEFGGGRITGVTVTLSSTTPGAAFTACAIVIDNASNAPTTVLPQ